MRRQIESVAAQRRALPPGGQIPENYVFERTGENGMPEKVEMSKLFGHHNTLILYSFMYGPERDRPCPMCTHLLDSINGGARHVGQRASLYIVAKSPNRAPDRLGTRTSVDSPRVSVDRGQSLRR